MARYSITAPSGAADFTGLMCGISFENGAATIEAEPGAWPLDALRQLGYTITDAPTPVEPEPEKPSADKKPQR